MTDEKKTPAVPEPPQPPDTSHSPHPAGSGGKFRATVRTVGGRLRFILLMIIVGVIAGKWEDIMNHYDRWRRPPQATSAASQQFEYYCGMHPSVISDEPGNCPICGMPLTKRPRTAHEHALPAGVLGQVQLTPLKMEMGRIATVAVGYRLLSREVRTVGVVDYDETRRATISARFKGRLDKLLVNYVGQKVSKGDALAAIYSPDLVVAQSELLTAAKSLREQKAAGAKDLSMAESFLDSTRKKLELWGFTGEQIDQIIRQGKGQTEMTIFSPQAGFVTEKKALEGRYVAEGDELYTVADLGSVWLQAKIFESDIQGIAAGQAVEVTSTAYPNEVFAGRITFISLVVDPGTRTLSARVEVANPEYKLKPGMYASAIIRLPMGQVTPIEGGPGAATAPAAASGPASAPAMATEALARAYLKLAALYAADKTDPQAAKAMIAEVAALAGKSSLAAGIGKEIAGLDGKGMEQQRGAFRKIGPMVIQLLKQSPPQGMELFTAHCPMEKGGDWITASKEIHNPYYGSEMLSCGSITGKIELQAASAKEDKHFVEGYFCPVYPERLFAKPEQCPMDQFPLKYSRVEETLAVPASAVIDTGLRKVAYRQAALGMFDLVEVRLGPRAGEFYPVISGLKEGDEVAAQGAFLVDAENRLNPAAAAQYFGASGGSSAEHKH